MRVISGLAKGRKLIPVPGEGTRPILDRVKENLFNILGSDVVNATFLDLFAGTGGVGIEALSRGATQVVFVDMARKAVTTVNKNLVTTRLQAGATVIQADAFRYLDQTPADTAFDYIYVAPPQYQDLWAKALLALDRKPLLADDGLIVVQIHPKEYHAVELARLERVRERTYGSTALHFYMLRAADNEPDEGALDENG